MLQNYLLLTISNSLQMIFNVTWKSSLFIQECETAKKEADLYRKYQNIWVHMFQKFEENQCELVK